ncbi:MAG: hypothetical protein GXX08_05265 [Firmicutes bacterium]|nr:hypothetical protein [Bacillota bacterium]
MSARTRIVLLIISSCIAGLLTIGESMRSLAGEQVHDPVRTVRNLYEAVDWQTFGQYKANFHTHTARSDGTGTPAEMIDAYHDRGYSVLAITDHDYSHQQASDQVTYPWTDYGRDPGAIDIVAVPGQEIYTGPHDLLSLFNTYPGKGRGSEILAMAGVSNNGGLAVWAHPGQYHSEYFNQKNPERFSLKWYVDSYRKNPHLIGMEVINQKDRFGNGSYNDRMLWDQVLTELLPTKMVWGFANDDSHNRYDVPGGMVGASWNVLLLPELTYVAVRNAVEAGQFYFVSRYTIPDPRGEAPTIVAIDIDETAQSITVTGKDYDSVTWISEGRAIHTGERLEYTRTQGIGKYVRAVLTGPGGEAFTQPFEVLEMRQAD